MKKIVTTLMFTMVLAACGGGSSNSDSNKEGSSSDVAQNNTPQNNLTECLISRFDLNPASGTLSKKSSSLRADADVQFPAGVVEFDISAGIRNETDPNGVKQSNSILSNSVSSGAKGINGSTGRAFVSFGLRQNPVPGKYVDLFVSAVAKKADGSTTVCELTRKVNYILVD